MNTSPIDALYVLGTGSRHRDLELRFSLRSMEMYCPWVRRVWVVGARPEWLTDEVTHIPADDVYCTTHNKDANIILKVKKACEDPRLAEEFLLCNDDQVVTAPITRADLTPQYVKIYTEGEDREYYDSSGWKTRQRETLRRFGDGAYAMEPHMWNPMLKSKFLQMTEEIDWENGACIVETLYHNFAKTQVISQEEAGTYGWASELPNGEMPKTLFVGWCDVAFRYYRFRVQLLTKFPRRSRFEKDDITEELMQLGPNMNSGLSLPR